MQQRTRSDLGLGLLMLPRQGVTITQQQLRMTSGCEKPRMQASRRGGEGEGGGEGGWARAGLELELELEELELQGEKKTEKKEKDAEAPTVRSLCRYV